MWKKKKGNKKGPHDNLAAKTDDRGKSDPANGNKQIENTPIMSKPSRGASDKEVTGGCNAGHPTRKGGGKPGPTPIPEMGRGGGEFDRDETKNWENGREKGSRQTNPDGIRCGEEPVRREKESDQESIGNASSIRRTRANGGCGVFAPDHATHQAGANHNDNGSKENQKGGNWVTQVGFNVQHQLEKKMISN